MTLYTPLTYPERWCQVGRSDSECLRQWRGRLMLVLVVWLLTTQLTSEMVSGAFVPPPNLTIAFIGSLVLPSITSVQFGHPGLFTFNAAIQLINQQSAAWRANQSLPVPLLPYTTLIPIWYDSKADPGTTVNAAFDAIQAGAISIVGDFLSPSSQQIQYVAARYRVPQISPAASGIEFTRDHATIYPYFLRNNPSVGIQAYQMTHFLKNYFGWKKIALFHATDLFAAGAAQMMAKTAPTIGVTILVDASFNIGDTDMSYQIQRIVDSGARIIVHWGLVTELQVIFRQIKAGAEAGIWPNLLGDGYQWILGHPVTTSGVYLNSTGGEASDIRAMLPGMIGLNYYLNTSTAEYIAFDKYHRSLSYWNVTSAASPNTYGFSDTNVYDAVFQIAGGLDYMISQGLDPTLRSNRPDLYQSIRNRTFNGATGYIFADSTGDRPAGFGVFNYRRAEKAFVNVGVLSSEGDYTPFDQQQVWEYLGTESYLSRPYDTKQRGIVSIGQSAKIGVILICCLLIVLFMGVQLALFKYRNNNLIKGSSPVFLFLYVLGIQLLCASVIPRSFESEIGMSPHPCEADLWLTNLGYILLIGALLVKTYRLQAIFNMTMLKVVTKLSDGRLLKALTSLMLMEVGLLLGLQYGSPMSLKLSAYDSDNDYYSCHAGSGTTNEVDTIYSPATVAVRFTVLFITAVSAFRVRNIPDAFNESKQLLVTIYNLLFLSVLLPVIDSAMGRGKQTSLIAYAICVFMICILSVLIMFVPKFMNLYSVHHLQKSGVGSHLGDELEGKSISPHQTSGTHLHPHTTHSKVAVGGGVSNGVISPSRRQSMMPSFEGKSAPPTPSFKYSVEPSAPGIITIHTNRTTVTNRIDSPTPPASHQTDSAQAPPPVVRASLSILSDSNHPVESLPMISEVVTHPNQVTGEE